MRWSCADAASDSSRPFSFRTALSIGLAKSIAAAAGTMPRAAAHARIVRWNSAGAMALGEVRYRVDAPTLRTKTSPAPPPGADGHDTRVLRRVARRLPRRCDGSGSVRDRLPRRHHPPGLRHLSRRPNAPARRAGLPRSPLASPCSVELRRTSGRDRREVLRRQRGTRRSDVRDSDRSPGRCDPGLADDRPRDARLRHRPER